MSDKNEGEGIDKVVVVVTSPDVVAQILDAQREGGMPSDNRMAYSDGFTVGSAGRDFVPKTDGAQLGGMYVVAYNNLPNEGIGSKADVHDTLNWYQQHYPMNHAFNTRVESTLRT